MKHQLTQAAQAWKDAGGWLLGLSKLMNQHVPT